MQAEVLSQTRATSLKSRAQGFWLVVPICNGALVGFPLIVISRSIGSMSYVRAAVSFDYNFKSLGVKMA